jgi:hypothetical protein
MIEIYFAQLETQFQDFPLISSYSLSKKIYNAKQGFIKGNIVFEDGSQLNFTEIKNTDKSDKIKYSYHYMNQEQHLVFRYDNAPHHHELSTFPHHKHLPSKVEPHKELTLRDVLLEIAQDKNLSSLTRNQHPT